MKASRGKSKVSVTMATLRSRFSQTHTLGGLALTLALIFGSGCNNPTTPVATSTPVASATPQSSNSPTAEASPVSYEEIARLYQEPAEESGNGWPELQKFLAGSQDGGSSGMEVASALDLSEPADAATFDSKILPLLKSAFQKSAFTGAPKLLSGQDPINPYYRDLRALCDLLTQRADQLQSSGKKEQAVELVGLPLALAHALQSRPETVSVNDFSSKYAAASLATIADWASTNALSAPQLDQLLALLAKYRPDYHHMVLSISVDFVQLENSLDDQGVRTEILGLGLSRPEEIQSWKDQLRALRVDAEKLYGVAPIDAKAFNDVIAKLAGPIQGIVIDYPNVAALQKRSYASYLATELALTLEKHRLSKPKEGLTPEQAFQQTFGSDTTSAKVAEAMLEVRTGKNPGQFTVAGRPGMFALVSPDPHVVFYER